ncbi:MAG TPA: hypothetical protein VN858_09885 [Casimicrobiaceae bacterium]|nr:hypothetical protein [Casimicrobiaceae bacterium]
MQHWSSPGTADIRRLVLGTAFAIGIAIAMAPHMGSVRAADLPVRIAQTEAPAAPKAGADAPAPAKAAPKADGAKANADRNDAADDSDTTDDEDASKGSITADRHGIVIDKGGKHIRIEGLGRDREYDSFQQFVQDAPWLAGLVFLSTLLVFLVPLLIVVLLIWYKLRKNRIANETMLKLAERGVVPPAAAMDAVASGTAGSVAAAATAAAPPPGMPAYEQVRYVRRRAVWSDLRKGVILLAIGLGLSFWSILDDGTANSVGLVLLFLGLGYCALWFFEDRTAQPEQPPRTPPAGGV